MYRPVANEQDAVPVPRLVFAKLTATGSDDARFRVALYILSEGGGEPEGIAAALHLPQAKVRSALDYWEGAGLIERAAPENTASSAFEAAPRRRLTTREVTKAGGADATLGAMVAELQRIFGGVVSQSDINIFVTLYAADGIPADLILLAAGHCAADGKPSARYIEKLLLAWRRDGIADAADADRYLRIMAQRRAREDETAALLGLPKGSFTVSERKKIACWHEEYAYGQDMLEAARLAAGEKSGEIRYLDGILKQWHRKGYRTPRDLQQAEENRNLRVTGPQKALAPEEDILMNTTAYVPMKRPSAE